MTSHEATRSVRRPVVAPRRRLRLGDYDGYSDRQLRESIAGDFEVDPASLERCAVSCPSCRGAQWIVYPVVVIFDATKGEEGLIRTNEIRCGPCGYVASPHSPEGEAVLARYAAALRVASASGRRWPSARGMPDDA